MINRITLTLAFALFSAPAIAQDDQARGPEPGNQAVGASASMFLAEDGEAIYVTACAGCHQPQGQGAIGAGQYPPLSNTPRLQGGHYPAWIVVNGISGMPALGDYMSDAQVVAVINYLQQNLGNDYEPNLTVEDVAGLRGAPTP